MDAPTPWLATAFVPGPSLQQVVERHGPLSVRTVLLLVAGIAEALEVIHRAGVVHRDLKPANVLIAEDGPRVIDFGIARGRRHRADRCRTADRHRRVHGTGTGDGPTSHTERSRPPSTRWFTNSPTSPGCRPTCTISCRGVCPSGPVTDPRRVI
ncbi:protein kinase [Streptomyces sp. NPDC059874]|uniref:protein kinase domain-containing protein n=1 Tax=Streptomyces sp. NPDC059874 TaxID=3346983 RepID=UPI003657A4E7